MKQGGRRWGEKGFTLVELLVVMSILAVLAAIVFPTVTGVNTKARSTAQPTDIQQMQTGVDRFNADDTDGSPWPTKASLAGASPGWSAGALPTAAYAGNGTKTVPYTFTVDSIAGVDFASAATVDGQSKTFVPDYVSKPKHASDTITLASGDSQSFTINKFGITVTVALSNGTGSQVSFDAWGIDKDGKVWIFVDRTSY
jgi:prepilin-type N-terminal cleavage/methylation domain-containing protein